MLYIKIPGSCMLVKKRMNVARRLKNVRLSKKPFVSFVKPFVSLCGKK
jgi:hypothetical protein